MRSELSPQEEKLESELIIAVDNENIKRVRELLPSRQNNFNISIYGIPLSHYAIKAKLSFIFIKNLLEITGFQEDSQENTVLHVAAETPNQKDLINYCIQQNIRYKQNKQEESPLDRAMVNFDRPDNNIEALLTLPRYTILGAHTLGTAVQYGRLGILKYLTDPTLRKLSLEVYGCIALKTAIQFGQLECLKWLVQESLEGKIQNQYDLEPMHDLIPIEYAILHGQLDILKWLVDPSGGKLSLTKFENKFTQNPIERAIFYTQLDILKWLIDPNGGKLSFKNFKDGDKNKLSPCAYTIQKLYFFTYEHYRSYENRLLFENFRGYNIETGLIRLLNILKWLIDPEGGELLPIDTEIINFLNQGIDFFTVDAECQKVSEFIVRTGLTQITKKKELTAAISWGKKLSVKWPEIWHEFLIQKFSLIENSSDLLIKLKTDLLQIFFSHPHHEILNAKIGYFLLQHSADVQENRNLLCFRLLNAVFFRSIWF